MKIVARLTNTAHLAFAGGDVESKSEIIEIPDTPLIREWLKRAAEEMENPDKHSYLQLSFSILVPQEWPNED